MSRGCSGSFRCNVDTFTWMWYGYILQRVRAFQWCEAVLSSPFFKGLLWYFQPKVWCRLTLCFYFGVVCGCWVVGLFHFLLFGGFHHNSIYLNSFCGWSNQQWVCCNSHHQKLVVAIRETLFDVIITFTPWVHQGSRSDSGDQLWCNTKFVCFLYLYNVLLYIRVKIQHFRVGRVHKQMWSIFASCWCWKSILAHASHFSFVYFWVVNGFILFIASTSGFLLIFSTWPCISTGSRVIHVEYCTLFLCQCQGQVFCMTIWIISAIFAGHLDETFWERNFEAFFISTQLCFGLFSVWSPTFFNLDSFMWWIMCHVLCWLVICGFVGSAWWFIDVSCFFINFGRRRRIHDVFSVDSTSVFFKDSSDIKQHTRMRGTHFFTSTDHPAHPLYHIWTAPIRKLRGRLSHTTAKFNSTELDSLLPIHSRQRIPSDTHTYSLPNRALDTYALYSKQTLGRDISSVWHTTRTTLATRKSGSPFLT